MNTTSKTIAPFVLSALVGFGATLANDADAAYRHYSSTFCYGDAIFSGGRLNNGEADSTFLGCPIIDDSTFSKGQVTHLRVYAYDNSTVDSVDATACATFHNSVGATCGAWVSSGISQVDFVTLSPPTTAWTSAAVGYFPEVRVILPGTDGGRYAKLMGYHVDDL
ncbi:hypothetical protein [Sorangium sp. So ce590]|uniref:hypothetical protein n=1 Tax=unclassified Sorangium TaxID=2621164 RepID=UPI003F5FEA4C